jgi:hypothetical protein
MSVPNVVLDYDVSMAFVMKLNVKPHGIAQVKMRRVSMAYASLQYVIVTSLVIVILLTSAIKKGDAKSVYAKII